MTCVSLCFVFILIIVVIYYFVKNVIMVQVICILNSRI